jgi:hypothetical protein
MTPSPEELLLEREDVAVLERSLHRLPARYERCIRLYYGIGCAPMTQRAIGKLFGLCGQSIHCILAKAARLLRKPHNDELRNHFRDRFPSIARADRKRSEYAIAAKAKQRAEQLEEMERLRNPPSVKPAYVAPDSGWRPPKEDRVDYRYLAFVRERQAYAERLHAEAMAEAKAARERHVAERARMRRPVWETPTIGPAYGIIRGFDAMLAQQTEAYRDRMNALCLPHYRSPITSMELIRHGR